MKKFYTAQTCGKLIAFGLFVCLFFLNSFVVTAQVSLSTLGTAYTQDFNTFDLGTTADLPANWAAGGTQDYNPGGAYSNTGAYSGSNSSYSLRNASTSDYAWGAKVAANSGTPTGTGIETITLTVVNNTGATITSFDVSWVGEQYSRDDRASVLRFSYSINGGAFTDIPAQDVTASVNNPAGNSVNLNPIASTNRSTTISSISLLNGQQAQFRFSVLTGAGSDNNAHIGVDDFSLTPQGATCSDGIQNGDETGVDCGGTNCPACPPAPTTTAVTSSANPSFTGDNVMFTATVTSGGSPVTTGTVTFFVDGVPVPGNPSLNGSGQASFSTSTLTEGSHVIAAFYNGATGFSGSSGTIFQVVNNRTVVNGNSFCNTGSITLADGNTGGIIGTPGTPYPSNIFVSGLSGTITSITVDLKGVEHQKSQDIDLLLVAPTGEKFIIMSGVGDGIRDGFTNPNFIPSNLTLSDAAATALSRVSVISSGTYRPASYEADARNIFPAPAPAGPYSPNNQPDREGTATFASVFNGINPNGTWRLYATDDTSEVVGSIEKGWCLNITTCAITSVTFDNASVSACNNNGTPDPSDDYFTADVTVVFENAPTTGTLRFEPGNDALEGGGATSVSVTGLTSPYTFTGVRFKANGTPTLVELEFSDLATTCVRTKGDGPTVNPCSCDITSISFGTPSACNNNGTPLVTSDDYFTADVTVVFENAPTTGTLRFEPGNDAIEGGGATFVSVIGLTSPYTFTGVRFKADGTPTLVEIEFSALATTCVQTKGDGPTVSNCPCTPPVISDEPDAAVVCEGGSASFTVVATGTGLSYNWEFLPVGGMTWSDVNPVLDGNPTLNLAGPLSLAANGNQYRVVITNDNGTPGNASDDCSTTSAEVTLTVNPLPQITTANAVVCVGDDLDLNTRVTKNAGTSTFHATQADATNNVNPISAMLTNLQPPNKTYWVRVAESGCFQVASITVTVLDPQPGSIGNSQNLCKTKVAQPFIVLTPASDAGGGTLTYQWESSTTSCESGFTPIQDATDATYAVPGLLTKNTYFRRRVFSTLNGTECEAVSNCVTITVLNVDCGKFPWNGN